MFCLPKDFSKKFIEALKSDKIVPEKLIEMTSEQRRTFFEDIVGKENAKDVNALLESKLLLKDQKKGLVTWAKKVSGITKETRNDILSKIERMDKVLDAQSKEAFLEDLAAKKLGTEVTFDEAKTITNLSKETVIAKEAIPPESPKGSKERMEYGTKSILLREYVDGLKGTDGVLGMPFKEWLKSPMAWLDTFAGTAKSIVASLDNSFVGRQGIKILYTHPTIWVRAFLKTWTDIGKELLGKDAIHAIKADVVSRPNALNGKYEAGKYDLGIKAEEAFPTSLPSKIPILGRLYRASEAAYNGAALRMRADYADYLIEKAEKFGVDTLDKEQAQGIGKLTNSMTGRGAVNLTEGQSRFVNVAIFSIKFLKSNFDTLTAHRLGFAVEKGKARDFVRREAATNLVKMIATVSTILFIAEQLWPGSVETDSRSADFGKIKIRDTRFDITGGMSSIVVLASRLVPTVHNGKLSFWSKSSSGKYTDLLAGKYGQMNVLDVLENFIEGKASPLAGALRDLWKGEHFGGEKVTVGSTLKNLVTPISIQTFMDLKSNPNSADITASMMLEGLGISANTYALKK